MKFFKLQKKKNLENKEDNNDIYMNFRVLKNKKKADTKSKIEKHNTS